MPAAAFGAAYPTIPVADTIRRVRDDGTDEVVDRIGLLASQTPQGMRAGLLETAFARFPSDGDARFTDEAALLMACTIRVHPILGDPVNLKVTLPADLAHAAVMVPVAIADAWDTASTATRSGPARHSASAGSRSMGHRACTGIRMATSLSMRSPTHCSALRPWATSGVCSRPIDGPRVARTAPSCCGPSSTAFAPRTGLWIPLTSRSPALDPGWPIRLDEMCGSIASLLNIGRDAVSVKASTGNLDGSAGAGRSIEAEALVSIVRVVTGARDRPPGDVS